MNTPSALREIGLKTRRSNYYGDYYVILQPPRPYSLSTHTLTRRVSPPHRYTSRVKKYLTNRANNNRYYRHPYKAFVGGGRNG